MSNNSELTLAEKLCCFLYALLSTIIGIFLVCVFPDIDLTFATLIVLLGPMVIFMPIWLIKKKKRDKAIRKAAEKAAEEKERQESAKKQEEEARQKQAEEREQNGQCQKFYNECEKQGASDVHSIKLVAQKFNARIIRQEPLKAYGIGKRLSQADQQAAMLKRQENNISTYQHNKLVASKKGRDKYADLIGLLKVYVEKCEKRISSCEEKIKENEAWLQVLNMPDIQLTTTWSPNNQYVSNTAQGKILAGIGNKIEQEKYDKCQDQKAQHKSFRIEQISRSKTEKRHQERLKHIYQNILDTYSAMMIDDSISTSELLPMLNIKATLHDDQGFYANCTITIKAGTTLKILNTEAVIDGAFEVKLIHKASGTIVATNYAVYEPYIRKDKLKEEYLLEKYSYDLSKEHPYSYGLRMTDQKLLFIMKDGSPYTGNIDDYEIEITPILLWLAEKI